MGISPHQRLRFTHATLMIAVGGIAKQPGVIDDKIVIREYVGLTVMFDHDVTDGAPVARFIKRLQELMTSRDGLEAASNGDIHNSECKD